MADVYLITNRVTGKGYVGVTTRDPLVRWREHVTSWKGRHYRLLQSTARKNYKPTEEHRKNISAGVKKSWDHRYEKFGPNGRT